MRKRGLFIISLVFLILLTACQSDEKEGVQAKASDASEQVESIKEQDDATENTEQALNSEETETVDMEGAPQEPVRDEKIPPYELVLLDGETIQLDQFEGKVLVMTFFTTWCTYCEKEIPALQKFSQDIDDLVVVGINVRESKETLEPYLEEKGVTFPVVLDETGEWASMFYVSGFPTTVFISPEGILLGSVPGYLPDEQMLEFIDISRTYGLKEE